MQIGFRTHAASNREFHGASESMARPTRRGSASARQRGGNRAGNVECGWMLVAFLLVGLPALCAGRTGPGRVAPPERTRMIVVLKDDDSLRIAREMCTGEHKRDLHRAALHLDLSPDCYLPSGACRRVFRTSVRGVSGEFSSSEVALFRRCIPDGIKYMEDDVPVEKQAVFTGGTTFVPATVDATTTVLDSGLQVALGGDTTNSGTTVVTPGGTPAETVTVIPATPAAPAPAPVPLLPPSGPVSYSFDDNGDPETAFDSTQLTQPGEKVQELHVANWNLDRIDQRELPLNKKFTYGTASQMGTGKDVTVYILDSGIRISHREFKDWYEGASRATLGYDFVDDDEDASDCNGHGTLVASTAVGKSVGIAKQSKAVSVRVLDCEGNGDISTTVAGLDWVAERVQKPAVVAMSLGVAKGRWSKTLEESVKNLIDGHGVTVIVAAGNSGVDSCSFAPANVPETITVGATELKTKSGDTSAADKEQLYEYSNSGPCVDIFAPGVDVFGACGGEGLCSKATDEAYTWSSGTSIALPAVAGVAAIYLGEYPDASPAQVKDAIINGATLDKLETDLMRPDTPNRLLYSNVL